MTWIAYINGSTPDTVAGNAYQVESDSDPTGLTCQDQNGYWRKITMAVAKADDDPGYYQPRGLGPCNADPNTPAPIQY